MKSFDYLKLDPKKPVIFLDIDGVLNGGWQHEHLRDLGFPTLAVGLGDYVLTDKLDTLINVSRKTQAQWVIVSSWVKSSLPTSAKAIEYLKESFGYTNIRGSLITSGGQERGEAVWRCVQAFGLTRYAVVDDSKEQMYDRVGLLLGEHLVSPSGRYGLQDPEFAAIHSLIVS